MVLHNLDESGTENITIKDKRLRKACEDLERLGDVDIRTNMAILSLVGQGLKNMVGISGRFFGVLGEAGVNVEMISQGLFNPLSPLASPVSPFSFFESLYWRLKTNCNMMILKIGIREWTLIFLGVIGASEINISCIICEEDADRALSVIHTHLFTFLD